MTTNLDSPRCKEAMLRLGIAASDIEERPLASFAEDKLLMEFQLQRKQIYDQKRITVQQEIATERAKIVEEQRKEKLRQIAIKQGTQMDNDEKSKSNDIVQREKARLRKLEECQKREFQDFVEYEIKMQEIKVANDAKRDKERKKEEALLKEKMQRMKEWEQLRKEKEEAKYIEELEELKRQETLAQKQFAEAQRLKEKEVQEEKQRRALRVEKELERRRKQVERETNLEQMQRDNERAALEREQTIEQREEARMAILAQKREESEEQHRLQAIELRRRVQRVKEKELAAIQTKREHFEKKTAKAERRRARFEAKRANDIQLALEESHAHMAKVRQSMLDNAIKYQNRKIEFEKKDERAKLRQIELQAEREREHQRRQEQERNLRMERIDAIRRQQRARNYKCKKIREQIDIENQLTKRLKEKSKKLIDERRRIARDSRRQKEVLSAKVEHIKASGQFNPATLMREFGLKMPEKKEAKVHLPVVLRKPKPSAKSEPDQTDDEEDAPVVSALTPLKRKSKGSVSTANLHDTMPASTTRSLAKSATMPGKLHRTSPMPKIGALSEMGRKRLIQCGYAYNIDMEWLARPSR